MRSGITQYLSFLSGLFRRAWCPVYSAEHGVLQVHPILYQVSGFLLFKNPYLGTCLVVQRRRLLSQCREPGLIPGQGSRSCLLIKSFHASVKDPTYKSKTRCCQINKC